MQWWQWTQEIKLFASLAYFLRYTICFHVKIVQKICAIFWWCVLPWLIHLENSFHSLVALLFLNSLNTHLSSSNLRFILINSLAFYRTELFLSQTIVFVLFFFSFYAAKFSKPSFVRSRLTTNYNHLTLTILTYRTF